MKSVALEALDCTVCFDPLEPPVFQLGMLFVAPAMTSWLQCKLSRFPLPRWPPREGGAPEELRAHVDAWSQCRVWLHQAKRCSLAQRVTDGLLHAYYAQGFFVHQYLHQYLWSEVRKENLNGRAQTSVKNYDTSILLSPCLKERGEISQRSICSGQGHMGLFDRWFVISLTLVSNLRSFGPYGKEDGVLFVLPATSGRILGFHARSGGLLEALGTYVKMD